MKLIWHGVIGDPETSPLTILIGFLKALIIMITFGFIYETFVEIFRQMFEAMQVGAFGSTSSAISDQLITINSLSSIFLNTIGTIFYLVLVILLLLMWFQTLGRGLEMLILRFRNTFCLYRSFKSRWRSF